MNCAKQDQPDPDVEEASGANDHERLRRQLLEMIKRNEERRRLKAK